MQIFQKKKLSKITILLLQIIAIASLFLFFFSREAIYIFKDFIDRIPLDATFESLIYRFLLPFKMLANSPSLCAVMFLVVHIFCATYQRNLYIFNDYKPLITEDFDIFSPEKGVNEYNKNEIVYLQTMRLLF